MRKKLQDAVSDLKGRKRFGLVFEEHVPETSALLGLPIHPGAIVQRRDDRSGRTVYLVKETNGRGKVIVEPISGGEIEHLHAKELLVVKRFGDPIYPALTSVGSLRKGPIGKAHHAVINGENFHALQLFSYLYEGMVDCIYLDPPYNTGARDWKYNNHYVDKNDSWRHSKWLSMMEKRLKLAKRLLRPDGVFIITIDEHEVHHLGMLIERLFGNAQRQMVSICINPSGVSGEGLSRVEEYAMFCFFGSVIPAVLPDDMLTEASEDGEETSGWESLLRRGNAWYRKNRPNLCYPILIDAEKGKIVGVGDPFHGENEQTRPRTIKGYDAAWPVRNDKKLGIWRVDGTQLTSLVKQGYAYATTKDEERGTWTIRYLMSGTIHAIDAGVVEITGRGDKGQVLLLRSKAKGTTPKTIWHRGRHTAGGSGGTQALAALLGERGVFPFPKSVYSVQDCLAIALANRKDALILDFFAGSGTTLHATCLLNSQDNGTRKCVLVTNNEVSEGVSKQLYEAGYSRGDAEFEKYGIFEKATRPRCHAVIGGIRPDGRPVEGDHLNGRPYANGFPENVEFFRVDYLDPDDVDLGGQFDAILPALWLAAGGIGDREMGASKKAYSIPKGSSYGVLFRESRFRMFRAELLSRPEISRVWLVTDSEEAFAEMCSNLPRGLNVSMLYRDYLRNFRINTRQNL